jgi:hypothetical protein
MAPTSAFDELAYRYGALKQVDSMGEFVATRGSNDNGSIADLPWAAVFDPTANVRALTAIQARGFRAATEVIDRLVKMTEPEPASENKGPNGTPAPSAGADVDRVVASWQKLAGQLAGAVRGSTLPRSGSATFDFVNSDASGQVRLDAAGSGPVTTEVWLHNRGAEDLGDVRLRCSDLLAHDGRVIDSARVRFAPDTITLVARSSRGVNIEVDVTGDAGFGCYRGTLLADGHADVWLPVVLVITPQPI